MEQNVNKQNDENQVEHVIFTKIIDETRNLEFIW